MSIKIDLKEKVDVNMLKDLCYSKKLLEESTTEWNYIQLLEAYSKNIIGNKINVSYTQDKYGRLNNKLTKGLGFSYTNMYKPIRNLLAHNFYWYVDIKNCQPTIIYNLCKKYNIECSSLLDYVNNRDRYFDSYELNKGIKKKESKSLFISLFYGKKNLKDIKTIIFKGGEVDEWIIKLLNELINIRKIILSNPEYTDIISYSNKKRKQNNKDYNLDGASFCKIIQDEECKIIMAYYNEVKKSGYVVGSLIYDGIFIDNENKTIDRLNNNMKEWQDTVCSLFGVNNSPFLPYIFRLETMDIDDSYLLKAEFDYYDQPKYEFNTISHQYLNYDEITNYFEGSKFKVLKSPYATGKTTLIRKILSSINDEERVIFLTMRQSLARSIDKDFKKFNFINYLNKKESISYYNNRIIISIDSLYKIKGVENNPYNIVICDEYCSLLNHISFDGIKNPELTYNIFESLLELSTTTYFLDGDISNREVLLLKNYYNYVDKPLVNTCINIKYNFELTTNYDWYIEQIEKDLLASSNVVIVSMSGTFTEYIGEKFKYVNPLIINANSDDVIKNSLYDVNKIFTKHQLVCYSPTVSNGVDYNIKHFNKMYGYMCNGSVGARDYFQMLFRCRDIEDKNIIIYSKNLNKTTLPKIITFEELKYSLYKNHNIHPLLFIELWNKWDAKKCY